MSASTKSPSLPAQPTKLIESGNKKSKKGIRRPLLIDRRTGLLLELPTTYIYRNLGNKSLNTQLATLNDLAFLYSWIFLQSKSDRRWISPESRLRNNEPPLTVREIHRLIDWCQYRSVDLAKAIYRDNRTVKSLPHGECVKNETAIRRILNIRDFIIWLVQQFIEDGVALSNEAISRSEAFQKRILEAFNKNLGKAKKPSPIRSLEDVQIESIRSNLKSNEIFNGSSYGNRDRLIVELLLESGIRAGELLKLQCSDVTDAYEIRPGQKIGRIDVFRRPNDPFDDRADEPAVKTFPGPVQIPKILASRLKAYIIGDRRIAMDQRRNGPEHPYLFVCHSGPRSGKPMSRRNLNRIVAKLKNIQDLPSSLSPHVLRHSHLTEIADKAEANGRSGDEIRAMLIGRAHWSSESKMPELYTKRRTERMTFELIKKREKQIEPR